MLGHGGVDGWGLAQHVEPARVVQDEVVEDDGPDDHLGEAGAGEVLQLGVHQGEPLAHLERGSGTRLGVKFQLS